MHISLKAKRIIFFAFLASLVSAIISSVLLYFFLREAPKTNYFRDKLINYVSEDPEKNTFSILLMGYGGAGHPGGVLTDSNIIVYVDNDRGEITLISIPRDLWVPIPVRSDLRQNFKINHAYFIGTDDERYAAKQSEFRGKDGGGNLAKYVFEETLDIKIDYYAAIDFERFENAIDALDGVDVKVPVSFTDKYFPVPGKENLLCGFSPEKMVEVHDLYSGFELEKQFECRYETLEFVSGINKMDGSTALKFVRSRHSDQHGGDFARGERTLAVIKAIGDKLLRLEALDNIDDFYSEFSQMITTDIDEDAVLEILSKIGLPEDYTVKNVSFKELVRDSTSSDGQYILVPSAGENNFGQIKSYLLENI